MKAICSSCDYEMQRLEDLRTSAQRLVEARNKIPSARNEDLKSHPEELRELNAATLDFFLKTGALYGSSSFVTDNDAMNLSYGIGDDSKMELNLKAATIGKAWQAFVHMLATDFGLTYLAQEFERGIDEAGAVGGNDEFDMDREALLRSIFDERYG